MVTGSLIAPIRGRADARHEHARDELLMTIHSGHTQSYLSKFTAGRVPSGLPIEYLLFFSYVANNAKRPQRNLIRGGS